MGVKPSEPEEHHRWMDHALRLARIAERTGEVPVGAVLIKNGALLGEGYNQPIAISDPTAHAEIQAIRQAALASGNYRLPGSTLYVTLEPCAMCAGAIVQARLDTVVYGTSDSRSGAAGSVFNILHCEHLNHRCRVVPGVREMECRNLLKGFFQHRRG